MRYFLTILFILFSSLTYAQERWAVVVGISDYPKYPDHSEAEWTKINGANDIELIIPMLKLNGFSETNITVLTNSQATKANIKSAILGLNKTLKLGDIVFIHFSGHGQLITDVDGEEGMKGYDESFIPYDAQKVYADDIYTGENHIVDDELNGWLHSIKKTIGIKGRLVVVLDACHSGGGTRDESEDDCNDVVVRGVRDRFKIPISDQVQTIEPHSIDWLCISACKSLQENEEYKGYGRLSYALSKVLISPLTIEQLIKGLTSAYESMPLIKNHLQDPHIEYNGNKLDYVL